MELLGHKYVAKGESVLRYNEIGTTFYLLLKGINSAWVPSNQIGVANDLQTFLNGLVTDITEQKITQGSFTYQEKGKWMTYENFYAELFGAETDQGADDQSTRKLYDNIMFGTAMVITSQVLSVIVQTH